MYKQKNNNDTEDFIEYVQKVVNNTKIMCLYCFLEPCMVQYVQLICGKGISPLWLSLQRKPCQFMQQIKLLNRGDAHDE